MADGNKELHGDSSLAERGEHGVGPALEKNYESSEIELRPIVSTTVIIVLTVVISMVVVYVAWVAWRGSYLASQPILSPIFQAKQEPAGPRIQVSEPTDLKAWRKENSSPLVGYKMNEDGTAQIPITEAIKMIGANGELPKGADWSLKPGEKMVGGVIMTPEQVAYANQPPSAAYVQQPTPAATPAAPAASGPAPAAEDPAKPAAAGAKPNGQ